MLAVVVAVRGAVAVHDKRGNLDDLQDMNAREKPCHKWAMRAGFKRLSNNSKWNATLLNALH